MDAFPELRYGSIFVLTLALVGVTILGILHDVDPQALTAIYTAVIAGAIGHQNGYTQGKQDEKLSAAEATS